MAEYRPQQQQQRTNPPPATVADNSARLVKYAVMVRHSPFPLKSAVVEAANVDEAKAKFVELARAENDRKCRTQEAHQGLEDHARIVKARRDSFARAEEALAAGVLDVVVCPAEEADARRKALKNEQRNRWGEMGLK